MKKIYQDTTFYLIVFIISYFLYIYPFEILNELLFKETTSRQTSLYYTLLISVLVIFYFRSRNTFLPLKLFVYEGMGIGFISFWIINIALVINIMNIYDSYSLGISSLTLIILITFYSIIKSRIIKLKNLKLQSKKISNKYNFIFISDIHLGTNSIKHLQKILDKISELKYDFILIGGDLIDSNSFNIEKLKLFKSINKPIYFVTGNHEYYMSNFEENLQNLNKFNIKILNNEKIIYEEINIIGIDDKQTNDSKKNIVKNLVESSKYNLVLAHKPSFWNSIQKNNDLMLSGHTHNGQIFPFNLFVKIQFKYKYGLYTTKDSNLYVSSGSGCWGPRMRLGTSNEIVSIELNPL